jgi:hypothetical protein
MNHNLGGLIISVILAIVGIYYNIPQVIVPGAILMAVCSVRLLRDERKSQKEGSAAQIAKTDAQLREELIEVQKLALAKLSGADEKTKDEVVKLLVEAGKHLGDPYTNSSLVYSSAYFVAWNREGLALVARARKLIDDYVAGSQPKA